MSSAQNEMASGVFSGVDLTRKIKSITEFVSKKTGFTPKKLISKSGWWDASGAIGAFHYNGKFRGQSAVLKVQGVKPETSEIDIINAFVAQNESDIIRPPKLLATLPWSKKQSYEAYVMENVGTNKVISIPTKVSEIEEFFRLYDEYRSKCRNKPWINKPKDTISEKIDGEFQKWIKTSKKVFPKHPLRKDSDRELVFQAVEVLKKGYKNAKWEFQHGHFSHIDLLRVKNQVVILSNLYWSWRPIYYDLVFAYHWFMYDLSGLEGISLKSVEEQRSLWLGQINLRGKNKRLLKLALLERTTAGLNLDGLSMDPKRPLAKYLLGETRTTVKRLLKELGSS